MPLTACRRWPPAVGVIFAGRTDACGADDERGEANRVVQCVNVGVYQPARRRQQLVHWHELVQP